MKHQKNMKKTEEKSVPPHFCQAAGRCAAVLMLSVIAASCQSIQRAEAGVKTEAKTKEAGNPTLTDIENLVNCRSSYAEYTGITTQLKKQFATEEVRTLSDGTELTPQKSKRSAKAHVLDLPEYKVFALNQPIKVEAGFPPQFFRKPAPGTPKVRHPRRKPVIFVSSRIGIGHNRVVAYLNEKPTHVLYSLNVKKFNTRRMPHLIEGHKAVENTGTGKNADAADRRSRYAANQPNSRKKSVLGCEYMADSKKK